MAKVTYKASPCPCGQASCKAWHVDPVAAVQGVGFTREQAEAVAALLNLREDGGGVWLARFELQTARMIGDGGVAATSTDLHFRADSPREAVASAVRWWRARHDAAPDFFARCCALTVLAFDPSHVTSSGRHLGETGRMIFEWKLETGLGPGVTIGPGLVADPRMVI